MKLRPIISGIILLLFALVATVGHAQERVTTFGLSLKPMIPWAVAQTGPVTETTDGIEYGVSQNLGYSFGMVIRKGISKNISFETGISSTQRNFTATLNYPDLNFEGSSTFRVVGYEIPTLGLVYVKLSDEIYMNGSFGLSLDLYPSNVATRDSLLFQTTARTSWFQASLLANVGWEYRTRKSGYFYLGASYHRPFSHSFTTKLAFDPNHQTTNEFLDLSGNYLTVDLRYFFHEDPAKREKKTKKLKKGERSLWNR